MRITTTFDDYKKGHVHVGVKVDTTPLDNMFRATHYVAILRAMRDFDKDAFYMAMTHFVDEKELQNVTNWLSEQREGCDDGE